MSAKLTPENPETHLDNPDSTTPLTGPGKAIFTISAIALFCCGIFEIIRSKVEDRSAPANGHSVQIEAARPVLAEFSRPNEESRIFVRPEVASVTNVPDREWRVWLEDPLTGKEIDQGWKPLPVIGNGGFEKPWNSKRMQFRSKTQFLKIEVYETWSW